MSKAYLITGVAGTGKSTLKQRFDDKDYDCIDIDEGYAQWQTNDGRKPVPAPINQPREWYERHDWYTNTPKLTKLIRSRSITSRPLLVFGNTADLYTLYPLFDDTFALEYNDEATIHHRIHTRTTNSYGKDPVEFAALLSYYKPMQQKFRNVGAIPIDCTFPLDTIMQKIETTICSQI